MDIAVFWILSDTSEADSVPLRYSLKDSSSLVSMSSSSRSVVWFFLGSSCILNAVDEKMVRADCTQNGSPSPCWGMSALAMFSKSEGSCASHHTSQ